MAATYRQRKPRYHYMTSYCMVREPGGLYDCAEGVYALNNGLAKQMIDVETLVPGDCVVSLFRMVVSRSLQLKFHKHTTLR